MASTVSPGANCSSRNTPIGIRIRVGIEAASRRPARPRIRMRLFWRNWHQVESQRSCQLVEPQRGVLEWLRAFAVIVVTKICSIGIQTGSSVFTSLTNWAYNALRLAGSTAVAATSMVLSSALPAQPHWLVRGAHSAWPERDYT